MRTDERPGRELRARGVKHRRRAARSVYEAEGSPAQFSSTSFLK